MKNSKSTPKRIWSTEELTIAYYISKWDYSGLNISEEDLVNGVICDTTVASLRMNVANFRNLLNIEGFNLDHTTKAQKQLVEDLKDVTMMQVRQSVLAKISSSFENIKEQKVVKEINKKSEKLAKANKELQAEFERKLALAQKGRNLKKI
jgi:hypothetical protein